MDNTVLSLLLVMVASSSANGQSRCTSMHGIKICRSDNVNVNYGSAYNLSCLINQNETCIWKQNGINVLILQRASSVTKYKNKGYTLCLLRVFDADNMDKGNYTCTTSGHQRVTSEAILVDVLTANEVSRPTSHVCRSKPGIQICISENITVTSGGVINLSCKVNELGICYWKLNGLFVENSGRHSFSREWQLEGNTLCSLKINKPMTLDSGNWTCGITKINDQNGQMTSEGIFVNVLPLNTDSSTTSALLTTDQEENQTDSFSQRTDTYQTATSPLNKSSTFPTTDQGDNHTHIFAHGIETHQTANTIYIVFGTLFIVVVILLVMATTVYFILNRRRKLKAKLPESPKDHDYEEIDVNVIELTTGPMEQPCTTFQPYVNKFKTEKDGRYLSIKDECNEDYEVPITVEKSSKASQ